MDLATKLITLRKQHQLTQSQLADKIHVSRKTISNWENHRSTPDLDSLNLLCELYQVPLDYFAANHQNPTQPAVKSSRWHRWVLAGSYGANLLLVALSIYNLFVVGQDHLFFITPLMIFNFCIFFVLHPHNARPLRQNRLAIITISLVIFSFSILAELGIVLEVQQMNMTLGNCFGLLIHGVVLAIGFIIMLFLGKN
ncbi:helix-turn-helix domain-containing protein [Fructilactobacillus carniphilus]|uniref:Helix-turn-helix domain-containing protein n=1 Tax=Fructilactobacillus carniphilus TaxID=2940297 RepID=A0ABY5C042_9LACO|nr:helix-turn-helix transcriptional regulator [Fructilactobacillus carniphilus]USS90691.1 helix-turn-helix domain-containing protein [Fructilactobacillus carniphilus]